MRIKNWEKFQHFKDRRPPWIKLHREILDQRDINALSDGAFRVLVGLWLLASEDSEMNGNLPCVDDICFRLRKDKSFVTKCLRELNPFLRQGDNTAISERYRGDDPEAEAEAEGEGEAEAEAEAEGAATQPETACLKFTEIEDAIREQWNAAVATRPGWSKCTKRPSGEVGRLLAARCRDPDWVADYPKALEAMTRFQWMKRGKFATILRPDTVRKILDGEWDDRQRDVAIKQPGFDLLDGFE